MTYEEILKLTKAGVEIWKPIIGYEGYYEVSNFGRVKSVERWVKQGNSARHVKESFKNLHIGPYGYPSVTLCKDKISKSIPIHRLIAEAFIPNPEEKIAIDHINTDRADFRLSNLRWVTPKENSNNVLTLQHCRESTYSKESLEKRLRTRKQGNTKTAPKTVFQYTKKGVFIKEYYSMNEAEKETGIDHCSISRALDDNTQSAGGYLWASSMLDTLGYCKKQHPNSRAILQFDKNGVFIKEWKSVKEAAQALGIHPGNIARNIKSTASPRKYKFKYKEDVLD